MDGMATPMKIMEIGLINEPYTKKKKIYDNN
jgi:hypothetical protein